MKTTVLAVGGLVVLYHLVILYSVIFTKEFQFVEFVEVLVNVNMDEIMEMFWNISFYLTGEQIISHTC